jgi:hypothetical protein
MARKFAQGKKSQAISDISGAKVPYTQLKTTWDNLRVEPSEYDPKHPQLTPAQNVVDATALRNPRPDNDPENVTILFGYTQNIFQSRVARSQNSVGFHAFGRIGHVGISLQEPLTGQALTTAIGTFAPGFDVTGVNATGTVNDVTPQDQIDVSVTGIDMTSTVNNVSPGILATGIGLTFAIGTETINHDRIFELDNGGVSITGTVNNQSFDTRTGALNGISATGSIGTIDNNSQVGVTGVAGTGDVGTFGESGDGTLNLSIQGVGIEGDIGTGIEIAESEIPESNTNGWGENAFGYGIWGGDPEVKGIGGVGTVTLDIFKGPNPQTGIAMTGTVGNFIVQGNLSVTGVSGTGTVNNVTLNTNVDATEIGATTAIGTYSVSINPGWGEGTWNEGTWGN